MAKQGNKSQPKEHHRSVSEILVAGNVILQAIGVSVKATQGMLRHASSRLMLDLYAQSILDSTIRRDWSGFGSFRSQVFPDRLVTCCRPVAQLVRALP